MARRKITEQEIIEAYRFLIGSNKDEFGWMGWAPRTLLQYASALRLYLQWCGERGLVALPAEPDTIKAWLKNLADKVSDGGQGLTRSTAESYLAAIATVHDLRSLDFNREKLRRARKWLRENTREPSRARALERDEVKAIIAGLDLRHMRNLRDACMLTLGFAGALRRSEIVCLDLDGVRSGDGCVVRGRNGLTVKLLKSKARKGSVEIAIPAQRMPAAVTLLDRWVKAAAIAPGTPLFRPVKDKGRVLNERLAATSVGQRLKRLVERHAIAEGCNTVEVQERVEATRSHSLRAGFVTSAGRLRVPPVDIAVHSRHKNLATLMVYLRDLEKWATGGLDQVGF